MILLAGICVSGVAQHRADPADRGHRPGRGAAPVIVIGHQPHLVGGPADGCVVLGQVARVGARVGGLGEHRDRQHLAPGVQGVGQPGDERGERLPVAGLQVLVVQVDPRVMLACGERHDAGHLGGHQLRRVQHPAHRRVGPLPGGDVGDARHDQLARRPQPADLRRHRRGLARRVLRADLPRAAQPVHPRRHLGHVLPVAEHDRGAVADVPVRHRGHDQRVPRRAAPQIHHRQPHQDGPGQDNGQPRGTGEAVPRPLRLRPRWAAPPWSGLSSFSPGSPALSSQLAAAAVARPASWSSITAWMMSSRLRVARNPTRSAARVQSGTRRCMSS